MKKLIAIKIVVAVLFLNGCAINQPPVVTQGSPVANVGADLNTAAAQAMDAFTHYETGNIDYLWAVQFALNAYQGAIKSGDDVKSVVNAWTAGKGKTLGDRLALLFQTSSGTSQQKVAALSSAVDTVALASQSSP